MRKESQQLQVPGNKLNLNAIDHCQTEPNRKANGKNIHCFVEQIQWH